jgi:hypothetical protein
VSDDQGAAALVPYRRGWRAPWRRQWGAFSDGHTRLSRLAKRIERELLEEYVVDTALKLRRVRAAARYSALAEMTLQGWARTRSARGERRRRWRRRRIGSWARWRLLGRDGSGSRLAIAAQQANGGTRS